MFFQEKNSFFSKFVQNRGKFFDKIKPIDNMVLDLALFNLFNLFAANMHFLSKVSGIHNDFEYLGFPTVATFLEVAYMFGGQCMLVAKEF